MNGIVARQNFEKAVQIFYNAFVKRDSNGRILDPNFDPIDAFKLTQSTLRVEQTLATTTAQYQFPILVNVQNGNTQFNTEIRLNMQDSFVPTELQVFTGLPGSATGTAWKPLTYENPALFTAASSLAIVALWNTGTMEIKINKDTKLTNWDLWRHYYAGQTQQTAPVGAGSPVNEVCGADDGFYPMEPYVLFIGSQNIQITINLALAITAVDAFSRVGIMFRGVLAQNSTVVS